MGKTYTNKQINSLPLWASRLIFDLRAEVTSLRNMVESNSPKSDTFLVDRVAEKEGRQLMSLGHSPLIRFVPSRQGTKHPEFIEAILTTYGALDIRGSRTIHVEPVVSNHIEVVLRK